MKVEVITPEACTDTRVRLTPRSLPAVSSVDHGTRDGAQMTQSCMG